MDRNNLPIKICPDCEKSSDEVDFHMKKEEPKFYYSKRCKTCQNIYRIGLKTGNSEEKKCVDCGIKNSKGNFDYCSLPEKKVFLSRCKKCETKYKELNGSKYIPERFCWRCEESSHDKEFRSKLYSSVGKEYYVNHCKECEKNVEYEHFLKKYDIKEIQCKFCNSSSLTKYFSHYKLRNNIVLYPYCFDCTDKNVEPNIVICGSCNKNSDEVEFIEKDILKQNGYETVYRNICKKCMTIKRKKYYNKFEPKIKNYKKSAIDRNHEWKLTDEEASDIFTKNCNYCNKISIIGEDMNGIDRVNNKLGYTPENCVSCCGMCNIMKKEHSVEDFIKKCTEIAKYDSSKKNKELEKIIDELRNEISKLNCIKKEIFIYKYNPWNPDGPDTKYTIGKTGDKISEDKILFKMSCKNPSLVEESVNHKLKLYRDENNIGYYDSDFEIIKEFIEIVINFIDT